MTRPGQHIPNVVGKPVQLHVTVLLLKWLVQQVRTFQQAFEKRGTQWHSGMTRKLRPAFLLYFPPSSVNHGSVGVFSQRQMGSVAKALIVLSLEQQQHPCNLCCIFTEGSHRTSAGRDCF